jgi:PAS domain S-box-containing protein
MVLIGGPDRRVSWVNKAFIEQTGYALDEVRGLRPVEILAGPNSDVDQLNRLNEKLEFGFGYNAEMIIRNKFGKDMVLAVETRPILDEHGRVRNVIALMRDITERHKSEEKIRSYAESLERSNRELEDFAYVASHDLQEPLRKIQAFGSRLETLLSPSLDDRGRDYLHRMESASERMQALINDLLTFSRVATKAAPPVLTDLNALISEVLSDLEVLVEQTRGTLQVAPLMALPVDASQMRQVFQNLIGNALKFTHPERLPLVRISGAVVTEPLAPVYEICVEDNGIGFEERHAERIFQIFQRLHSRTEYAGTGIGLAICRKIIERHGGTLTAKGCLDVGSTFIIRLPLVKSVKETDV